MIATSSAERPVLARCRPDLRIVEHDNRGEREYVVGDLLALEYYRLNEQEYFLLNSFDGKSSFDVIKRRFDSEFAPHCIRFQEIEHYLLDFQRKSLILFSAPKRGENLLRLSREAKLKKQLSSAKNLLAFRLRGIDPQQILASITPKLAWFFSTPMVILGVCFMCISAGWFFAHFNEFADRLPTMQGFFSRANIPLLLAVMIALKVAHELGHGIVFTKFGGRCHELGIMFLVFIPTLYVNTSDSWRIPNKWKRAGIAAAGVYVELMLAAIAVWGFWYAKPGIVQYCCLNVIVLGAISAVLFNGNPLLKFDAYYLLSDVLSIPNLQQRGQLLIRDWSLQKFFGIDTGDGHLVEAHTKRWLITYALLSFAYRLFVVFLISFALVYMLRPLGLQDVGKLLAGCLLLLFVLAPVRSIWKYFAVPGNRSRIEMPKARKWGASLTVLALLAILIPFPDRVVCPFIVQPKDSRTVYLNYDGKLQAVLVSPGEIVEEGNIIAEFRNLEVELEIAKLLGRSKEIESRQRMLRLSQLRDRNRDVESSRLKEEAQTYQRRLAELSRVKESLTLRAPRSGVVIAEWQAPTASSYSKDLEEWSGSSLSRENVEATFRRGQAFCRIGDPKEAEAQILIDQSYIDYIKVGQAVALKLDSTSTGVLESSIETISESDSEIVRPNVATNFGGDIETERTDSTFGAKNSIADTKPTHATFQAVATLPISETSLADGLKGRQDSNRFPFVGCSGV